MGPQFISSRRSLASLTMKFVVVLALFALAAAEPEAEADPWVYYNHAGYHPYAYNYGDGLGGYYGYGAYPYVYTAPKAVEKAADEPAAEVKEAEPAKVVTYPYYYPHTYGYAHAGYYPYTYAGLHYPRYYANSAGVVHSVAKREADSDANPESWYGHYGYAYPGYGY